MGELLELLTGLFAAFVEFELEESAVERAVLHR